MKHRLSVVCASVGLTVMLASAVFGYHSYTLSVSQLKAGLEKASGPSAKGFFLIDVRSPQEHLTGVIPGTDFNIEYRQIKARHHEIGAKPDDHIVVYCQAGQRSSVAAETLADLGYRHVYNVRGSMNAWLDAGYPVQPAGK